MTVQELIDALSKAKHKNAMVNIIDHRGDELFTLRDDFLTIDEDRDEDTPGSDYDPEDSEAHVHIVVSTQVGL